MQKTYTNPVYTYVSHPDLNAKEAVHHPVVIVGDGPGGLALAIDFALHGISTVVLDDNNTVSVGSRAICFAKRMLEIMNSLYYRTNNLTTYGVLTYNLARMPIRNIKNRNRLSVPVSKQCLAQKRNLILNGLVFTPFDVTRWIILSTIRSFLLVTRRIRSLLLVHVAQMVVYNQQRI
jgi:hypothetical protein|nr:FAD-dependent monooxygenase [Glaciecola sp. 33A]